MILFHEPITHPTTAIKVVLLSGLSDPTSCALSRPQQQFLDQLSLPRESKIYANFPYIPPDRDEQAAIPILLASYRNLSQFLKAKRSPYRERVLAHWQSLVDSCQGLLVITISCGLEILNVCLSSGIQPTEIEVLSLGPVAWQRPPVPHTLVCGGRDYVVNPLFRDRDVVLPRVGHMNYMDHPSVLDLAQQSLQTLIARVSSQPVACHSDPQ